MSYIWQPKIDASVAPEATGSNGVKFHGEKMLETKVAVPGQEKEFAEIRARAMKESLVALGRYDEHRVRNRLLENYNISNTHAILFEDRLIGFFVLEKQKNRYYLSHLYFDLPFQSSGFGGRIMNVIKNISHGVPIELNALKGSRSNRFYMNQGFVKIREDELDIYYEYRHENLSD